MAFRKDYFRLRGLFSRLLFILRHCMGRKMRRLQERFPIGVRHFMGIKLTIAFLVKSTK